jgi:hypothetical protein
MFCFGICPALRVYNTVHVLVELSGRRGDALANVEGAFESARTLSVTSSLTSSFVLAVNLSIN